MACFRQLIARYPERPEGYNKMGVVSAETGQLDEAERYFLEALHRDRMHAPALTNLGNVYFERGQTDQAIQHYALALQSDPEYPPAHRNLAAAYRKQGNLSASVSHLKRSRRFSDKRFRDEIRNERSAQGARPGPWWRPGLLWWVLVGGAILVFWIRGGGR